MKMGNFGREHPEERCLLRNQQRSPGLFEKGGPHLLSSGRLVTARYRSLA